MYPLKVSIYAMACLNLSVQYKKTSSTSTEHWLSFFEFSPGGGGRGSPPEYTEKKGQTPDSTGYSVLARKSMHIHE
jgi:hypothetical protein